MRKWYRVGVLLEIALFVSAGCGTLPGRPTAGDIPIDPDNVKDFNLLFSKNCSGCHGAHGQGGAALSITDPVYLAIADDNVLRKVITNGIAGTSMPAFAKNAGGMLTDDQVEVIVHGLREHYGKPDVLAGVSAPPYASAEPGDARHGASVYDSFCASCHGVAGKGGKASSIVDGSFLALLTDQELRTLVIVGRPDFGAPDWRNNIPGKPMSAQDVSDVVAWLSAQRPVSFVRPSSNTAKTSGEAP
ncbi:MAG TPA: c-type cytochrome [Candidatus Acidoferrum sp.]|nr:c-type cytochrome [Candidatus Acidoferrum sp.]